VVDREGTVRRVVTTDESGRYHVDGLHPGEYRVIAAGYAPTATPVRLLPGEPTHFDPVLSTGAGGVGL
jgi:uncharacterized surface anchored protein